MTLPRDRTPTEDVDLSDSLLSATGLTYSVEGPRKQAVDAKVVDGPVMLKSDAKTIKRQTVKVSERHLTDTLTFEVRSNRLHGGADGLLTPQVLVTAARHQWIFG